MDTLEITYRLTYESGIHRCYPVLLDSNTLGVCDHQLADPHPWQALDFRKCPNCSLSNDDVTYCPVALNLGVIVQDCEMFQSHTDVHLEVETEQRLISADTTIQRALSSLLGLLLAVSDCPHTRVFRPMARFHLPLASEEETIYRAASMYLLGQYFVSKEGGEVDLDLSGLTNIYHNLHIVNKSLAERIRAATESDATVNAVVLLDLLAKAMPYSITDSLHELRHLFQQL